MIGRRYEVTTVDYSKWVVLVRGWEPFALDETRGLLIRRRIRWWELTKTTTTVRG